MIFTPDVIVEGYTGIIFGHDYLLIEASLKYVFNHRIVDAGAL